VLRVDTDKLRAYATRIQNIVSRFTARAADLRYAADRERAKDEPDEELIMQYRSMAAVFDARISDLEKLITYFSNVSDTFEAAEANIAARIEAFQF